MERSEREADHAALEAFYEEQCRAGTAMSAHLPRLRHYAELSEKCIEFGVKKGGSSSALLMGCENVVSYDIAQTAKAMELKAIAPHWDYRIQSSLEAVPEWCTLLFIDSLHTFDQIDAELWRHADDVTWYIIFHDTVTFGSSDADGETGKKLPNTRGIRPAIDRWMSRRPQWRIREHISESHGLLVLERGQSPR